MKAVFAIFLIVVFFAGVPLVVVLANAAGDPMRFGAVLIVMIWLAMVFGKKFADWVDPIIRARQLKWNSAATHMLGRYALWAFSPKTWPDAYASDFFLFLVDKVDEFFDQGEGKIMIDCYDNRAFVCDQGKFSQ